MKNSQLKVLNQCTEEELQQEAQQELEILEQKKFEYNEEFLTFSGRPSLIDPDCMTNLLRELTSREQINLPASVNLIIYLLHKISFDRRSGYFWTTFEEIESHSTGLDNDTISKSLNILKKYNLICYFSGKGQRKSFIALKYIYNSPEGRGYKEKIKIKNILKINDNKIEFLNSGNSQKSKELETETFGVRDNSNPETFGVRKSPHIYINERNNIMKENENSNSDIQKPNPSYVPETRPQPPKEQKQPAVDERTTNILISNTEKNILNLFDELLSMKTKFSQINLVHIDPTPDNPHGVAQIKPYSASQRQEIHNLCDVIRDNLKFTYEKKRQLGLSVFEKSYTNEELLRLCSQSEAIQRRIF